MTARTRALAVLAVAVALLTAGIGGLALSAPTPSPAENGPSEDPDLRRLHEAGVTGENVTVGVVDVTGFDTDHPALSDRVVEARAFGPSASVTNGGRNRHGTGAAAVLARTAPDAELYLAAFDRQPGFRQAVTWLLESDVDVVVAPVSFYGRPGDGSATVSRVGAWATRQGAVFVAPTGNLARSHWRGRYAEDRVAAGTLRFGDSTRNYLAGRGSLTRIWLSWDRERAAENYTAELYRVGDEGTSLVARSRPYVGDDTPNERIVARLEGGTYFVRVRGPTEPNGTRLRLSSPTHRFQRATPDGSLVAPATGRGVVGVGAYDVEDDRVEPFSSRGPTADGRLGVDVVGPARHDVAEYDEPLVGSSAAAPYVGGVAALVRGNDPDLSPREVEHRLERATVDVGSNGTDTIAGHGLVVPGRSVANVTTDPATPSPDR